LTENAFLVERGVSSYPLRDLGSYQYCSLHDSCCGGDVALCGRLWGAARGQAQDGQLSPAPSHVTTDTSRSNLSTSVPTRAVNPILKASESISVNTRRNALCKEIQSGKFKNVLSHTSLLRPQSAMSSQLSAQTITVAIAIPRILNKRCSILSEQLGSSITPKYCLSLSIDMPRFLATANARHYPSRAKRRREISCIVPWRVTVHTPLPSGCQLRGDAGQR